MNDTPAKPKRVRKRKSRAKPVLPGQTCRSCKRLMTTGRATSDQLDSLHCLVADRLLSEIHRYQATGEKGVPPALLRVALSFLKLNGVDTPSRALQAQVDELLTHIPDMDSLDPH